MRYRLPEIPPPKLIKALQGYDLLPAIIFVPSRRRCDESASEVAADKSQRVDIGKSFARQQIFDEYVKDNPEVRKHKHLKIMLQSGIASHHAGHIPSWKLLIEKMMSAGLLNAIFATSTVAAGVDFPARTVVISNAEARGNDGWRPIEASELQQMTGRAGRRGKDNVGFVVLAPSNFQNPPRIAKLLGSPPDDLNSQFRATYSSLLNLLDAFGSFSQLREIVEKSFAFRETARNIGKLKQRLVGREKNLIAKTHERGQSFSLPEIRGFERLTSAKMRLEESIPMTRAEMRGGWLRENVTPGRIISKGRSGKRYFLILSVYGDKVVTMRDDGKGATFAIFRVNRIYENSYPIKEDSIEKAFFDIEEGLNLALEEPKLSGKAEALDASIELMNSLVDDFYPKHLSESERSQTSDFLWEAWKDAEVLQKTERDIETLKSEIWLPFEHRAKVLDHFGYVDYFGQTVTPSGKWLADVRVDRPLLVGEALNQGLFERLQPTQIAGLMAALAADAEREYGEIHLSEEILEVLTEFENTVFNISNIEWKFGVEPSPELNFSAAAAAESWAEGATWDDLVRNTKAAEGDLVRLLSRTGEALMQIAHLGEPHQKSAKNARVTAEIMLRSPIR